MGVHQSRLLPHAPVCGRTIADTFIHRVFVEAKLRDLATEKRDLQARLETLEATTYEPIDAEAVLRDGLASLANLPRLMESASIEERKEFVHAFVAGITVQPEDARPDVLVRPLPLLGAANSSVGW